MYKQAILIHTATHNPHTHIYIIFTFTYHEVETPFPILIKVISTETLRTATIHTEIIHGSVKRAFPLCNPIYVSCDDSTALVLIL